VHTLLPSRHRRRASRRTALLLTLTIHRLQLQYPLPPRTSLKRQTSAPLLAYLNMTISHIVGFVTSQFLLQQMSPLRWSVPRGQSIRQDCLCRVPSRWWRRHFVCFVCVGFTRSSGVDGAGCIFAEEPRADACVNQEREGKFLIGMPLALLSSAPPTRQ